jgi:AcrR family transcriptional regulator
MPGQPPPNRSSRNAAGTLSRDRIVVAAIELADREGLSALSMRKVAAAFDAGAMSLYRHFRSKDELLDAMADAILVDASPPALPPTPISNDWRDVARATATGMRAALLAHPGVAPLLIHRPPIGPNSFQAIEASLAWLRAVGFDETETPRAFQTLITYVLGAVSLEAPFRPAPANDDPPGEGQGPAPAHGRRKGPTGQRTRLAPSVAEQAEELRLAYESLPASRFPNIVAMAEHLFVLDADEQFLYGLEIILSGLEERRAAGTTRHPAE